MQEHPVPRQITTFEFKLIGELTIKQFGFLAFGISFGVILFFLVPSFLYLNLLVAAIPVLLGVGFAFVPINERPMDLWLRNLIKRLTSPTQYYYRKHNLPPKILMGITLPPREVLLEHVKAQQKLNEYLQQRPKNETDKNSTNALDKSYSDKQGKITTLLNESRTNVQKSPTSPTAVVTALPTNAETFTFQGSVLSPTGVPLSNIMIYVKKGVETVRLFKTDAEGVFQNNIPLELGEYVLELEDPRKKYDFARMKLDGSQKTLQIVAQKVH